MGRDQISDDSTDGGAEFNARPRVSFLRLFFLFSYVGISSFGGGVPAWMHRAFVEKREWIDEREFFTMLALARLVPGVNVINLAVLIGNRLGGYPGAIVAVIGMLVAPSLVAVGLAQLYGQVSGTTWMSAMVSGTAAAAAGLLVATGFSSIGRVPGRERKSRKPPAVTALIVFAATFVLVGLLLFPTVPTVLGLAPISVALAYIQRGRSREASS